MPAYAQTVAIPGQSFPPAHGFDHRTHVDIEPPFAPSPLRGEPASEPPPKNVAYQLATHQSQSLSLTTVQQVVVEEDGEVVEEEVEEETRRS